MADETKPEPISDEELKWILEEHKKWLESEGKEPREGVRADLSRRNLENRKLERVHLEKAYLFEAHLENSDFLYAHLENADLLFAHLENAKLKYVYLENAKLKYAHLENADLRGAHLDNANLELAHLENADLELAHLENADLRGAVGIRLDSTFIRNARFSPVGLRIFEFFKHGFRFSRYPNDPWSVLRQIYAGPRVLFHILFLLAFALPYVGRVAMLSFASQAEQRAIQLVDKAKEKLPKEKAEQLTHTIQNHNHKQSLWVLLLHWDKGYFPSFLALLLILYNAAIFILVTSVGPLRDQEERSGYSPAWEEYGCPWWVTKSKLQRYAHGKKLFLPFKPITRLLKKYGWMILLHRFVTVVFYISFVVFLWNMFELLQEPVWVYKP